MGQRSVRRRGWLSGAIALLLMTGCLPAPLRVAGTGVPREGSLKNKPSQVLVGASQQIPGTLSPGAGAIVPGAVAAPIISHNGGNVLSGAVRAPAEIISHNGGNIISHNGGNIVSNNGGSIISHNGGNIVSNNGGGLRIAQVPLAFTTVRLKDAAGAPVKDDQGHELVTKTDANGNYTFPVDVKGRNLVIEADVEGQTGKLKSLLPKDGVKAGSTLDVDLTSTLTLAYILEQYVKGDLATFERLPKDIEAKARTVTETAIVEKAIALPTSLEGGAIVAKVDEVRKADPSVDKVFEEIRALLVVAGITNEGDGLPGLEVDPGEVGGLLRDAAGNLYVYSQFPHTLWKITTDGIVHTIVASGNWGYNEQTAASYAPGYTSGMAFDSAGRVIIADTYNYRIVRVNSDRSVSVIAGTGEAGFSADGTAATSARLDHPSGLAIDPDGVIYFSDTENNRVRRIMASGAIETVCGTGTQGSSATTAAGTSVPLNRPQGLLFGGDRKLFVAEYGGNQVRSVDSSGSSAIVNPSGTVVGTPIALATSQDGRLLSLNHASGVIERISSTDVSEVTGEYLNDGGHGASLSFPHTIFASGDSVFAQSENRIVFQGKSDGSLIPLLGRRQMTQGEQLILGFKMAIDKDESVYIADMGAKKVLRFQQGKGLVTFAGNGRDASLPVADGGLDSALGIVSGISLNSRGDLIVSSIGRCPMVRIIEKTGNVRRLIGSGRAEFQTLPIGPALTVGLSEPYNPIELKDGSIVFSELNQGFVGILSSNNVRAAFDAGTVSRPDLLIPSLDGGYFMWERGPNRLLKWADGELSQTVSADLIHSTMGDDIMKSVAIDGSGHLYFANGSKVSRVGAKGTVKLVAGLGAVYLNGQSKDDGLFAINDIRISPKGDLYILEDTQLKRLEKSKLDALGE